MKVEKTWNGGSELRSDRVEDDEENTGKRRRLLLNKYIRRRRDERIREWWNSMYQKART